LRKKKFKKNENEKCQLKQKKHAHKGDAVDGELCTHCRRRVPVASLVMHQLRCARINYFCELCDTVVAKVEKEEHEQVAHAKVECSQGCGAQLMRNDLQVSFYKKKSFRSKTTKMVFLSGACDWRLSKTFGALPTL